MRKLCCSLALLFGACIVAHSASAGCRYIAGSQPETLTPSISPITVDPSVPDRTQIGPEIQIWSGLFTYMYCDASPAYTQDYQMLGTPIPGSNGLYATNIPGIAYAVAHSYNSVLEWFPYSRTYTTAANWTIEPDTFNAAFRLRFFKYGPVRYGGGTITPATIARYVVNWSGGALNPTTINLPGVLVRTPACVVTDIPVNMGSIAMGDSVWKGVGARGPDVPFDLTIRNCSAGFGGLAFTLTPVTTLLSAPDWHLTLDNNSTAGGVGVQIRRADNDAVVPICGNCKVGFGYDASRGGNATLALKANYLQTAARVTPGNVSTSIWFSVTYA